MNQILLQDKYASVPLIAHAVCQHAARRQEKSEALKNQDHQWATDPPFATDRQERACVYPRHNDNYTCHAPADRIPEVVVSVAQCHKCMVKYVDTLLCCGKTSH